MRPFRCHRHATAIAASVIVLAAGCSDTDGSGGEPTSDEATAADAADDPGTDGQANDDGSSEPAREVVSEVTVEPLDAPRSSAEIRVGEIIVEFDGEVTDEGTVLTLEEPILFDFDSAQLKSGSREALDDVAEVLAFYEGAPVQVVGHTDDQGDRDYNLELSQDRADAVVAGLVERGIPADRLEAEGRAFDEPVASNDSEGGRAQNRRVEVLIVGGTPLDDGA